MNELEGYRKEIDEIDKELTRLFEERMNVVLKVAKYKEENSIEILNKGREEEVILKNVNRLKNKDYALELKEFFYSLMGISKNIQKRKINKD